MIKLKETIVVEGKYDKAKVANFIDTNIIECDGFAIFSDKEKMSMFRSLARKDGLIILTDSDTAGFKIRNYIASCVGTEFVYHAYIPEIVGKEKRKTEPSKEGLLGVEGVSENVILEALRKSGVTADTANESVSNKITMADLYEDGFWGRENSAQKKANLLSMLGLPRKINSKGLVRVLNTLYTYDRYKEIIKTL